MAGGENEAGHGNMVSGNLAFVLTVPGQQRPWPQRHKEKIRVMPSDDDKKDPKVGREENAKLGRRNISLLFIKGQWMLQHWGRRAENAKSFSIPKGKTIPSASVHLRISTFNPPGSELGTWEAKICEPLFQPQKILVWGMAGE